MSRRARALTFLVAALTCAAFAAAIAGGYGASVEQQLGELRPVLVTTSQLPEREQITARIAERSLEVRRVPDRFAPAAALTSPAETIGREPAVTITPGAYVTTDLLRVPRKAEPDQPALPADLNPVEIQVSGAASLAAAGAAEGGGESRVDVIVTTEPGPGGGDGRTYVAATGVPLLALVDAGDLGTGDVPALTTHVATLALTRAQALRLIDAESYARALRLIPAGG